MPVYELQYVVTSVKNVLRDYKEVQWAFSPKNRIAICAKKRKKKESHCRMCIKIIR